METTSVWIVLLVSPGYGPTDPSTAGIKPLTVEDAAALGRQSYIKSVVGINFSPGSMLRYRNRTGLAVIYGVPENYFDFGNYVFEIGAGFNREDIRKGAAVGVITAKTRRLLFGRTNPLNKIVYLERSAVPHLRRNGGKASCATNHPATLSKFSYQARRIASELAANSTSTSSTLACATSTPWRKRKTGLSIFSRRATAKRTFTYRTNLRSFAAAADQARMIAELLAAIGAISLLIGGIGVMNIMLVSVSERAREIGVRVALGARQTDIQRQFLIEALVLCLIGAALAVAVSFVLSFVAGFFLPPGWELRLSMTAMLAAVICAGFTGLVFGYFPARNAARLDPVEALARD